MRNGMGGTHIPARKPDIHKLTVGSKAEFELWLDERVVRFHYGDGSSWIGDDDNPITLDDARLYSVWEWIEYAACERGHPHQELFLSILAERELLEDE